MLKVFKVVTDSKQQNKDINTDFITWNIPETNFPKQTKTFNEKQTAGHKQRVTRQSRSLKKTLKDLFEPRLAHQE